MNIKDALLGVAVAAAYLVVCSISDDYEDKNIAQTELQIAQQQAELESKTQ